MLHIGLPRLTSLGRLVEAPGVRAAAAPATVCFPFAGDLIGGSHLSALGLIQHLDPARFKPLVLVQNGSGAIATLFRQAGITVEPAPSSPELTHGERPRARDMLRLAADVLPLSRALHRRRIDIVHTNDGRTHATWALPARLAGTRLVWHHRGSADAFGLRYIAPLLANEVISVSEYALSGRRRLGARGRVIHSPFDTATTYDRAAARADICRELGLQSDARLVAFSGYMIARKRPLLFVDAIAALRRARPDLTVHGVMLGAALEISAEAITARAVEQGVADAIHLVGYRTPGPRWLAGCDALLVPAVDEPFGRTLIEAMLVGTPVVATDCGGNGEALRGGSLGLLVPPEDASAMATALAILFDRPDLRDRLAMLAREDARTRFGEQRHAEQVMAVYDRLLARRRGEA